MSIGGQTKMFAFGSARGRAIELITSNEALGIIE
jgi:hypothetical protein